MVFTSTEFIFFFLPACYLGFLALRRWGAPPAALAGLTIASALFYGFWSFGYLALLLALIAFNYLAHRTLVEHRSRSLLWLGIAVNLSCLGYFKYYDFFIENLNLAGFSFPLKHIVLPLAISFFTFQKIALLVETYRGRLPLLPPLHFVFIILFFPQLIAGPIVRPMEMQPQLERWNRRRINGLDFAVGATLFTIGAFKKLVLADSIAPYADFIFAAAGRGEPLPLIWAWAGAFAYTFQIYFDFSAYSDMAIGLARLFGFRLPQNFASPYKAASTVEFWRRWHMTLSRFLRDFLYIPLGGSRHGVARQHFALLATMVLGGLWHGANWTFVLWGAFHGILLSLNHALRAVLPTVPTPAWYWSGRIVTFVLVVFGWVLFRAGSAGEAWLMMQGMVGMFGIGDDRLFPSTAPGFPGGLGKGWLMIAIMLIIAGLMPNSQELLRRYRPVLYTVLGSPADRVTLRLQWRPSPAWAIAVSVLLAIALVQLYAATAVSPFIYFQF